MNTRKKYYFGLIITILTGLAFNLSHGRDQSLEKVGGDDFLLKIADKSTAQGTTKGTTMKTYNKPSEQALRQDLTEIQYKVTQQEGTEAPFDNAYHANKQAGIYVDIVSGEPLFSSQDKFDSGTGWPSFSQPIRAQHVDTKIDFKLLYPRTEVRSAGADSHLGHVFKDGPEPTGLRYCVNSASLRFIPVSELEAEGYAEFVVQFSQ